VKNAGLLLLEDGTTFEGSIFGALAEAYGEVVFSTSMTGYEESISDPSYRGQILVFSYPLIGNYSFRADALQSAVPQVRGVVVSENTSGTSGASAFLDRLLSRSGIPGIQGVDTRSLVRKVRTHGTMRGLIIPSRTAESKEHAMERLLASGNVWEDNLVAEVSTRRVRGPFGSGRRAVIIDCGMKRNLLRDISSRFEAYVVPYSAGYESIESLEPECIVVSSGPGDPSHPGMAATRSVLGRLTENYPVLGVCLGHQLLALSQGAMTYKLKFGHRGINHPVRLGERVYITSQNHGFAVDGYSLDSTPMRISQRSLNDGTVEGLFHENGTVLTSQYHPEGGPGPSDTRFMYDMFSRIVEKEA
jgi:carbamoyl-phosphate synthase small subunit